MAMPAGEIEALIKAATPAPQVSRTGAAVGLGALVLAGAALWLGRSKLTAARPLAVRAVRPLVLAAAKRRPLQAARLVARHPRQAFRLAAALR